MWVDGTLRAPAVLPPEKTAGTHYTRNCVGPSAGMNGCGKYRPHRDSIPVVSRYTDCAIPVRIPGHILKEAWSRVQLTAMPSCK
jgi:hypothetical protein